MAKIKNRELLKLVQQKQDFFEKLSRSVDRYGANTGLAGQRGHRVRPTYAIPNAEIIKNKDSAAAIILDNNPQYADKAGDFCSRVAIVAGIKGHYLVDEESIDRVNPVEDAAGIYINQRANTQQDLGLVSPVGQHSLKNENGIPDFSPQYDQAGKAKDPKNRVKGSGLGQWYEAHSDVTAYADTIQMVARTGGINLYAGHLGDRPSDPEHPKVGAPMMSSGVPNDTYLGVNLIAGNRIDDYDVTKLFENNPNKPYKIPLHSLQPMVKGHTLMKMLNKIVQQQGDDASIALAQDLQALIKRLTGIIALLAGVFSIGAGVGEMIFAILAVPSLIVGLTKKTENIINSVIHEINSTPMYSDSPLSKWHKLN